jgi:hypothetical protein
VRQRLQFGEAESLGRVAMRGAVGGKISFVAPRFGGHCVCCSVDTKECKAYDASTDRVQVPPIPMPVCLQCTDHALASHFAGIMQGSMLCVGIGLAAACAMKLPERPHDSFLVAGIAVGAVLAIAALAWAYAIHRRDARARAAGHHPNLSFSVGHGRTLLDTDNHDLVEELLALNPSARRLPTPLFWRRRQRREIANARTVKRD